MTATPRAPSEEAERKRNTPKPEPQAYPPSGGTVLLFGPPLGIKIDPRFPMPVSVCEGGKEVHYISREEATALIEEARREERVHVLSMVHAMIIREREDLPPSIFQHLCSLLDSYHKAAVANAAVRAALAPQDQGKKEGEYV